MADETATVTAAPNPSTTYEAASQKRRLAPWRPSRLHINAAMQAEGPTLRARSRSLIANSPYGQNASDTFASYATGTGIVPATLIEDEELAIEIDELFNDWTDEADADGLTDFYGMQTLVARAVFDAGECFVRERPRLLSDGLSVPVQYQLYEAEQLDTSFSTVAANGNVIRMGIEFNRIGGRVAYHFWRNHPGDISPNGFGGDRVRVPADKVHHVFKPLRPGQIRGRPFMTANMIKLFDLDQYDDAEMSRKKGAAMFMAFLVKQLGEDGQPLVKDAQPDDTGAVDLAMEPNIMNVLPPGFDVRFSEPADVGPNYDVFYMRQLYAIASSIGLPYHALSGDVSKANFSSLRAAIIETKRRIAQFQWECMIFQMCRPIWRRWLELANLVGAVNVPQFAQRQRALSRVLWMPPRWESVQPMEDAQADKLKVDSGFVDRGDIIQANGENPAAVDRRIARTRARAKALDLPDFFASKATPAPATTTPAAPGGAGQEVGKNTPDPENPANATEERQQQERQQQEAAA